MNQPEKDASKRMYMHRQVTEKIGVGITYHFVDPIDYGSTPTTRALGGILLRAESGNLPTVLDCQILRTVLGCFCRVWLYRFLRTQSDKFTCVCFGTERLTSVLVLALSYTGLTTLLCHRSLLRIRTRVVILILQHRCTW